MKKQLIPCIYILDGKAVAGFGQRNLVGDGDAVSLTSFYANNGADALLVFDFSSTEAGAAKSRDVLADIAKCAEVPVIAGGGIRNFDDVKRIFYTGCRSVVINASKAYGIDLLKESSKRFGKKRILVSISDLDEYNPAGREIEEYAGAILLLDNIEKEMGALTKLPIILHTNSAKGDKIMKILAEDCIAGVTGQSVSGKDTDLNAIKLKGLSKGISMDVMEGSVPWEKFKLTDTGLIPVIVQDYRNDEVLMMAWMNKESYEQTLLTGKMTYYSRSRKKLWLKGETSGHFQYVKSLHIDCDYDTILARVSQVGAACHTGNRSCFFTPLASRYHKNSNPYRILESVMNVIRQRREVPKEGSYTSYLQGSGLDKILKKVGEENTEVIIAAKNANKDELKYEVADYLYHLMVLMEEQGLTWEEVTDELSRR